MDASGDIPAYFTPIRLTMAYKYKKNDEHSIAGRKARCSIRGDIMRPMENFDPKKPQKFLRTRGVSASFWPSKLTPNTNSDTSKFSQLSRTNNTITLGPYLYTNNNY